MPKMTDPTDALTSFQRALLQGLQLHPGTLDPDVFMHFDQPNGEPRFTYVRLDGQTVTALANFTPNGHVDGSPCFSVGYAVPETLRNQGRAHQIVRDGIAELRNGFKGHPPFHVEAIVSVDNAASIRVATSVIGGEAEAIVDDHSKQPALRYTAKYETGT